MIDLNLTAADEVPAQLIMSKVKSWRLAPGVSPGTYTYLRVRGTQNIMGLPPATAKKVLAEKDKTKARKLLAPLVMAELAASKAGTPGGQKMILLIQSGDAMRQVTTAGAMKDKTAGLSSMVAQGVARVGAPLAQRAVIGAGIGAVSGAVARPEGRVGGAVRGALAGGAVGAVASPQNLQRAGGAIRNAMSRVQGAAPAAAAPRMIGAGAAPGPTFTAPAPAPRPPAAPARPPLQLADRGAPAMQGWDVPRQSGPTKTILPSGPVIPMSGRQQRPGGVLPGATAPRPSWTPPAPGPRGDMSQMMDDIASRGKRASAPKAPWSLSASLKTPPAPSGMSVLKGSAQAGAVSQANRTKAVLNAGASGDVWSQQKRAAGPGMVVGSIGGATAGARHGVLSSGAGGVVGGLVGDYVLPIVEQALLAAGPDFATVARPAALLASGIAGEISGRLIGDFLQPKSKPQEQMA